MKKWPLLVALLATPLFLAPITELAYAAAVMSKLGDLAPFEKMASDTLVLIDKGDLGGARERITEFETAWDNAEPTMRPKNVDEWSVIDDAADAAISSLRANKPKAANAKATVAALIHALASPAAL
ncbi:hypothetical protein LRX75_20925 [Rhizobium sp. DKSPLA3]|uniref:Histidine kinase n=1 Tax=Rhizobium quercicola TaxID=2901226 RepID=A0A9X1NW03_9HYPH|nr:hypothetical protein [Rhizobium quercicola]MCD7111503.1 hypothetical protein [Rhizobium quercicola]